MTRRGSFTLALLAALASGCSNQPVPNAAAATVPPPAAPAPAARPPFYYDLGSTSIDVSVYPQDQRDNYKLFASVCATCHTPARAINAPIIGADAWTQYVQRMHVKMTNNGITLSPADEGRILSFLTYDSRTRRTGEKFKAEQERLKGAFESGAR